MELFCPLRFTCLPSFDGIGGRVGCLLAMHLGQEPPFEKGRTAGIRRALAGGRVDVLLASGLAGGKSDVRLHHPARKCPGGSPKICTGCAPFSAA